MNITLSHGTASCSFSGPTHLKRAIENKMKFSCFFGIELRLSANKKKKKIVDTTIQFYECSVCMAPLFIDRRMKHYDRNMLSKPARTLTFHQFAQNVFRILQHLLFKIIRGNNWPSSPNC